MGMQPVHKLMQLHGIRAKGKRRFKVTTDSQHGLPIAPNLVPRRHGVAFGCASGALQRGPTPTYVGGGRLGVDPNSFDQSGPRDWL